MDKILIDTDVILDFFFDRKPFSGDAARILNLCEKGIIKGFVTPVLMSNSYYILRKTAPHEKVITNLRKMMEIIDIVNMDRKTVLEALYSEFKDFEDALQNYAAQSSKDISIIISRNIKDFRASNLSVMTPEVYLKTMR